MEFVKLLPFLIALLLLLYFTFIGIDLAWGNRRLKARKYKGEWISEPHDWKTGAENALRTIDYRDIANFPVPLQRREEQERFTEATLTLLAGGGILWVATMFQGRHDALGTLQIWGGLFLVDALLAIGVIRAYQVNRSYFRYGEWLKNCADYEAGRIAKSELYYRTRRVYTARATPLAILSVVALLCILTGYSLIALDTTKLFSPPASHSPLPTWIERMIVTMRAITKG